MQHSRPSVHYLDGGWASRGGGFRFGARKPPNKEARSAVADTDTAMAGHLISMCQTPTPGWFGRTTARSGLADVARDVRYDIDQDETYSTTFPGDMALIG